MPKNKRCLTPFPTSEALSRLNLDKKYGTLFVIIFVFGILEL